MPNQRFKSVAKENGDTMLLLARDTYQPIGMSVNNIAAHYCTAKILCCMRRHSKKFFSTTVYSTPTTNNY